VFGVDGLFMSKGNWNKALSAWRENMDRVLHEIASLINRQDKRFTIGISGHGASG
jgi:hypothetical protein